MITKGRSYKRMPGENVNFMYNLNDWFYANFGEML